MESAKAFLKDLRKDKDMQRAWKDNIAMCFKDNYHWHEDKEDIHTIANNAASSFMVLLLQKTCDYISIAERLYYHINPESKMDVPSYMYETVEKWYYEWQETDNEDFYNWCLENKNGKSKV